MRRLLSLDGGVLRRWLPLAALLAAVQAVGTDAVMAQAQVASDPVPTVETHVVEPGDTLWDLSERILGSPWLWPKVWSYNPEITNPHWIYPGDMVRFYPSEQSLPSQADLIAGTYEIPQQESDEAEYVDLDEQPASIEVIDTAPAPTRRRSVIRRFVNLFVTPQELAEAGTLTNAVDNKTLLSTHDHVYLTFKGRTPSPGDQFMVYRTLAEVVHPISEKRFGYMTQITGLAAVERVDKKVTRALLYHSVVEIERGQYVTPLDQSLTMDVAPKAAAKPLEGVVLAIQYEGGSLAGETQVVFVDIGRNAGLERGNQFDVTTQGDPLTGESEDMPIETIGRLLVIQANDTASTCLVTASFREIEPGARVVAVTR